MAAPASARASLLALRVARQARLRDALPPEAAQGKETGSARRLIIDAMRLTPADIATVATALDGLALAEWPRDAAAINAILDVYGAGEAPRYPEIDANAFPDGSEEFDRLLRQLRLRMLTGDARLPPWDAMSLAVTLLEAQDRDDAVRAQPEAERLNRAAMSRAAHLDWRRYRYAAIVVPGQGPERLDEPLSSLGKFRLALAVARRDEAPFLILSGGAVHPGRTTAVEALRMRDWLIAQYGVPPARIVVDPFARHTTTNLRNAARLLRGLGAPADLPALVVSDSDQLDAIAAPAFRQRVQAELRCEPGRIGPRAGVFALEYRPSAACLPVDPRDPLDP